MIILLSPSKTLDFETPHLPVEPTQPTLLKHTKFLAEKLNALNTQDISDIMGVSEKLSELNYDRFQNFKTPFTPKNSRSAIFAFKGDVYGGFDVEQLNAAQLHKAQKQVRILSGFYGLLRPFDLMQPYRLEMGTKLATEKGKNLYEFWGDVITDHINQALKDSGSDTVINLASNEYFKAVNPKKLNGKLVTPVFKQIKGNQMKVIALFAKRARGMMARHLICNSGELESFVEADYRYDETLSDSHTRLFTRAS